MRNLLMHSHQPPAQQQQADSDDSGTSCESGEEEFPDDAGQFNWELRWEASVYDEALLGPLVKYGKPGTYVTFIGVVLLLVVSFVLQVMVLWKVHDLDVAKANAATGKVFWLCQERESIMPVHMRLNTSYWDDGMNNMDCGPMAPTMMSNVANLDTDGDGMWSQAEASALSVEWNRTYGKISQMALVWKQFMRKAKKQQLKETKNLDDAAISSQSIVYTQLPLSWIQGDIDMTNLCIPSDPYLCGNLEARGALVSKLPDPDLSPTDRITSCERFVSEECPYYFGEVYVVYEKWSYEQCGERSSEWVDGVDIITTAYTLAKNYSKSFNAIAGPIYFSFLVVMLAIWLMTVLVELRIIFKWWVVLLNFPSTFDTAPREITTPREMKNTAEVDGEMVHFKHDGSVSHIYSIPWSLKVFTIIFNLIPRTIVCVCLAWVGTMFLVHADDYTDLILNGVALGFLIEVDNLLYTSVVGDRAKNELETAPSLKVQVDLLGKKDRQRNTKSDGNQDTIKVTIPNILILTCATGIPILHSYFREYGKMDMGRALRCLCHAAGPDCVTAQVLGGMPYLPEDELMDHR